tara:strand:- start:849 stop:1916 length:1068 start_codon:yes stop_codon:yes gene_type:complete
MTDLKLVEPISNTQILDVMIDDWNKTCERISLPSPSGNTFLVTRIVSPSDEDFQSVKTSLNTTLGIKMKKTRGSNQLVRTQREIVVVPETEEEELKLEHLRSRGVEFEEDSSVVRSLSKNPNLPITEFSSLGELRVEMLSRIDQFVTHTYISNCRGVVNLRSHDKREPNLLKSRMEEEIGESLYMYSNSEGDYCGISVEFGQDPWFFEETETINQLPTDQLIAALQPLQQKLKNYNAFIDTYLELVTVPFSEFFESLTAETILKMDQSIEKERKEELRKSQLVRKTVNVDLTFNLEIEMDTLDDVEEIKKVIQGRAEKELKSSIRPSLLGHNFMGHDHLEVKNENLSGVDILNIS